MFKGRPTSIKVILESVSSYDLFKKYCPNFSEVGVFFSSEFRRDSSPSAVIVSTKDGLRYKDFGENDGLMDIVNYLCKKFSITTPEAIDMIWEDASEFSKNPEYATTLSSKIAKEKTEKLPTIIDIKARDFNSNDIIYWNQFGWSKEMLVAAKTIPISHFWIDNIKGRRCIKADKLAYSYDYYFHNGVFRRKIYQPKHKLKWVSNVDDTIVQLVDVMPKKGDILFITSSKKDAGVFWRLNIDRYFKDLTIHGVAPNTETCFVPKQWLDKQRSRWSKIIIYYDNDFHSVDNPGVRDAKLYSDLYNIPYLHTPDNTQKDPSDFVKYYGLESFAQLLHNQLVNV